MSRQAGIMGKDQKLTTFENFGISEHLSSPTNQKINLNIESKLYCLKTISKYYALGPHFKNLIIHNS